jgi:hypothetical protein
LAPSPLPIPATVATHRPLDPAVRAARLLHIGCHHPGRAATETFIRRVYRVRYGARVTRFAPHLVALRDEAGEIVAAAGYRPAGRGPLFLERYLDAPVERLLAAGGRACPPRERIVEVGHLAANRAGEGRRLIALLAAHLAAENFQWAVCTLTQELRHFFVRLGIAPLALGVADPAALGAEAKDWGRYYEHDPVVLAGPLEPALRGLAR